RAAGTAKVLAGQIAPLPEDLAAGRAETSGAVAAKVHIDAVLLDGGSARRISVERVAQRIHLLVLPELQVVGDFARVFIDADGIVDRAVFGRGGDPNLVTPDDRAAPAFVMQRSFPLDVLSLAPFRRQSRGIRRAVAVGSAKLRPVVGTPHGTGEAANEN